MWYHYNLLAFMVYTSIIKLIDTSPPTTTVTQGELSGSWMVTRGGRKIAAFRGIPYAAPPVRELRFQSPMPAEPWSGTKLVTKDGERCIQYNPFLGIYGEEDCLYLNVFTPNVTGNLKLPVIVFIHGGAFASGSSSTFLYGPNYFLDEDIILVTINYRLGIFGFLSLEDNILPGNLGLKDQRAALRWVQDNIVKFGGDPAAVTLFGESAGAASVHYHMLYNSEEGLFRAGICHSGSALTRGAFQRPGDQKPLVKHLLNVTGCTSEKSSAIVNCLRKIPSYRLIRYVIRFFPSFEKSLMKKVWLSPVMEPQCTQDSFVTEDPWNKTTSLPMIIGTNKYEGLFTIAELLKDDSNNKFEDFNTNVKKILPYNLMFETSTKDPISIVNSLREFYLNNKEIDRDNVLQLADMISDGLFNYGTVEAVKRNLNSTYLYAFNYLGSKSFLNLMGYENNFGPTHVDELFFFFPFSLPRTHRNHSIEYQTADKSLSKQLLKIWVNFATTLKPVLDESNLEWQPVATSDLEYLSIDGPDNFTMDTKFYKDRMDFWSNLPFRNLPLLDSLRCSEEK